MQQFNTLSALIIFFTLSNKAASIRSLVYSKLIRRIRHMNLIKEETLMKLYTCTMSPLWKVRSIVLSSFRYSHYPCPRCYWIWEWTLWWYQYCRHTYGRSAASCSTSEHFSDCLGSFWTWCHKQSDWHNCWRTTSDGRPFASASGIPSVGRWWLSLQPANCSEGLVPNKWRIEGRSPSASEWPVRVEV